MIWNKHEKNGFFNCMTLKIRDKDQGQMFGVENSLKGQLLMFQV